MERMINDRLVWYLESNKLLTSVQQGFHKCHSTTDHRVRLETFVTEAFVQRQHIICDRLHWLPVPRRIQFKVCLLTYKAVHGLGPRYLRDELHSVAAVQARQRLRSSTRDDLVVTAANSKFSEKSFFFTAPRLWNCLPLTVCRKESADSFKITLKTILRRDADVLDT